MVESASGVQEMLQHAHEIVQKEFDVHAAFGKTAGDMVQVFAVRASHHELPWGMQLMAGLFGMTNGATVSLFPGHDSPLAMVVLNINDAQTRKSNIFVQLHNLAMAGDEQSAKLHAKAKDAHRVQAEAAAAEGAPEEASADPQGRTADGGRARSRTPRAARAGGAARKGTTQGLKSIMMAEFTPEAFFERCSVDWAQVRDHEETGSGPRLWYSTLVNIDEAYDLLKMLGVTTDDGGASARAKGDAKTQLSTSAASGLNRLLQTGRSSMACRSAASFGDAAIMAEGGVHHISLCVSGNLHPKIGIRMDREDIGVHTVCVKERFILVTGPVVEPHDQVSAAVQYPEGIERYTWAEFDEELRQDFGFPEGACEPRDTFEKQIQVDLTPDVMQMEPPAAGMAPPAPETVEPGTLYPHAEGFAVEFADGVATRVRYQCVVVNGQACWVPYFRIPNRCLPIPEGKSMLELGRRVIAFFQEPGRNIDMTDEAKARYDAYKVSFQVRASLLRGRSPHEAAMYGCGAWQLGMLAAGQLLLELAVGVHGDRVVEGEEAPKITKEHVMRAHGLLKLIMRVRTSWRVATGAVDEASKLNPNLMHVPVALPAPERVGQWQPTQREPGGPRVASGAGSSADDDGREEDAAVSASALKPDSEGVPAMDVGYGANGASVQLGNAFGQKVDTDRNVMRRILLLGRHTVKAGEVTDLIHVMRKDGDKKSRIGLRRLDFEKVITAGNQFARVGQVTPSVAGPGRSNTQAQFTILLPGANKDERVDYHNRLMRLCQVSLREVTQAIAVFQSKSGMVARSAATGGPQGAPPAQLEQQQAAAGLAASVAAVPQQAGEEVHAVVDHNAASDWENGAREEETEQRTVGR
jgi:hypothetical protein